jgi:hypothetical protein
MRAAAAIAILAVLPLSAALADVYRSVDPQGHVLYSDTPTPGAQLVSVTNPNSPTRYTMPANNPAGASRPTASSMAPKSADPGHDQVSRDDATRAVQTDLAQTRAEQCKKAQDTYQAMIAARRIYSGEANGERQYLSDADADQARVTAKLSMDEACKNQPPPQAQ